MQVADYSQVILVRAGRLDITCCTAICCISERPFHAGQYQRYYVFRLETCMATVVLTQEEVSKAELAQKIEWCRQLEAGAILYFPQTPVQLELHDIQFLLGQHQTSSPVHKNIAYKPALGTLTGLETEEAATVERLSRIMRFYSETVARFLEGLLTPYAGSMRRDYASFRPQEEQNRNLPLRKRNDLLHTDAFPTRPTYGARILRFFNNIHPERTRDWVVSGTFRDLMPQFVPHEIAPKPDNQVNYAAKMLMRYLGLGAIFPGVHRTPYDHFMIRFHNFLKESSEFQKSTHKDNLHFSAGSSWMVFTDTVPHAVLAGQYALEQTFLVDKQVQVAPEHAPLTVLERLTGKALV